MTYRERVKIEHPWAISQTAPGGVILCPDNFGYEMTTACQCGQTVGACNICWGRQAPPRKVKPRRKAHEKANG